MILPRPAPECHSNRDLALPERRRPQPRRPARFVDPTSRTSSKAPNKRSSLPRMSPTMSCCSGMTAASAFQVAGIGNGNSVRPARSAPAPRLAPVVRSRPGAISPRGACRRFPRSPPGRPDRPRHPELHGRRRKTEPARHHPHDLPRHAVDRDGAADDVGVGGELMLPQRMANPDEAVPPGRSSSGSKVRPLRTCTPSSEKRFAETELPTRCAASPCPVRLNSESVVKAATSRDRLSCCKARTAPFG